MKVRTSVYDVFLSYSTKDKATVHALAERLKADGLRVWLDAWEIRPGDNIPAKIEEGLENSSTLILWGVRHKSENVAECPELMRFLRVDKLLSDMDRLVNPLQVRRTRGFNLIRPRSSCQAGA